MHIIFIATDSNSFENLIWCVERVETVILNPTTFKVQTRTTDTENQIFKRDAQSNPVA